MPLYRVMILSLVSFSAGANWARGDEFYFVLIGLALFLTITDYLDRG